MTVELHGYKLSVYSWVARLALVEKGVGYGWVEVDPFSDDPSAHYASLNPFKRVPTLVHSGSVIYETSAITRYVDEAFDGPGLQRLDPIERARCNQILSIVDSYVYWPFVRQVFSHSAYRPRTGLDADPAEVAAGLQAAKVALGALDGLASDETFLCGRELSLADIHLAPMIGYFARAEKGAELLETYDHLARWWTMIADREAFTVTIPSLP